MRWTRCKSHQSANPLLRGAHWRKQHQYRDDENWLKDTMLAWDGDAPNLYYKPVILKGHEQTYEPKERSY